MSHEEVIQSLTQWNGRFREHETDGVAQVQCSG